MRSSLTAAGLVFGIALPQAALAKPRPSGAVYVVKTDAGKCRTDVSVSPIIYNDDKKSARTRAREECTADRERKYCYYEVLEFADSPPTTLVVIKGKNTCSDGTPIETFGIGAGISDSEATENAKKNLGQRNWNWSEKNHGFERVKTVPTKFAVPAVDRFACGSDLPAFETKIIRPKNSTLIAAIRLVAKGANGTDNKIITLSMSSLIEGEKRYQDFLKASKEKGEDIVEMSRVPHAQEQIADPEHPIMLSTGVALSQGGLYAALCRCSGKECSLVPKGEFKAFHSLYNTLIEAVNKARDDCEKKDGVDTCAPIPTKNGGSGTRG